MIGAIYNKIMITGSVREVVSFSKEEVETFYRLKPVFEDLIVMIDHGVFDFKRGRAILHRDDDGQLRKIMIELTKWSK